MTGFVDGECALEILPGYACKCRPSGEHPSIPAATQCASGDLSSGVEKVIVGIFTLGLASASRYHTLSLARAEHASGRP